MLYYKETVFRHCLGSLQEYKNRTFGKLLWIASCKIWSANICEDALEQHIW